MEGTSNNDSHTEVQNMLYSKHLMMIA